MPPPAGLAAVSEAVFDWPQPASAAPSASPASARRTSRNAAGAQAPLERGSDMRGTLALVSRGGQFAPAICACRCWRPPATPAGRTSARSETGRPQRRLQNRKGSRGSSYLDSDCLFPKEQGATGMNSSVLTASLTGRIQFFLRRCVVANHLLLTYDNRLVVLPSPLWSCCDLEAVPRSRAVSLRGVNKGTSPRAPSRP